MTLLGLAACSTDLPIQPETSRFSEIGLSLSTQVINFSPTFIGRTSSDTIAVEYGDTLDLVLLLSTSDPERFIVTPDSVPFSKRVRRSTLTVKYVPSAADKVDLGYLYLLTYRWVDSLKTFQDTTGIDSLRLAGAGRGSYLDLELVFIPGGVFPMGLDSAASGGNVLFLDEWNEHQVTLGDFFIGRYEVTNLQYYEFWKEVNSGTVAQDTSLSGHTPRDTSQIGKWPEVALDKPNFPVIGVSWYDAMAFCSWLSLRTGERYILPTEAQWEYVARSGQQREYPWSVAPGEEPPADTSGGALALLNIRRGGDGYTFTAPVDAFPDGASKFGPLNLAGNVWEWCLDWYDPGYYRSEETWVDPQGSVDPEHQTFKVIRGGSWLDDLIEARCTNRSALSPENREINVGFRVVRLP